MHGTRRRQGGPGRVFVDWANLYQETLKCVEKAKPSDYPFISIERLRNVALRLDAWKKVTSNNCFVYLSLPPECSSRLLCGRQLSKQTLDQAESVPDELEENLTKKGPFIKLVTKLSEFAKVSVFERIAYSTFEKEKGVDVALAVDATKLTLQDPQPFVLVSSDSDFFPLVETLSQTVRVYVWVHRRATSLKYLDQLGTLNNVEVYYLDDFLPYLIFNYKDNIRGHALIFKQAADYEQLTDFTVCSALNTLRATSHYFDVPDNYQIHINQHSTFHWTKRGLFVRFVTEQAALEMQQALETTQDPDPIILILKSIFDGIEIFTG